MMAAIRRVCEIVPLLFDGVKLALPEFAHLMALAFLLTALTGIFSSLLRGQTGGRMENEVYRQIDGQLADTANRVRTLEQTAILTEGRLKVLETDMTELIWTTRAVAGGMIAFLFGMASFLVRKRIDLALVAEQKKVDKG